MDEKDHQEMKELHAKMEVLEQKVVKRDARIRMLIGELIKKNAEVDYPVAVDA